MRMGEIYDKEIEEEWSDGEVEIRLALIVWSFESGRRRHEKRRNYQRRMSIRASTDDLSFAF